MKVELRRFDPEKCVPLSSASPAMQNLIRRIKEQDDDEDELVAGVRRDMPSATHDEQMREAMKRGRGAFNPEKIRRKLST